MHTALSLSENYKAFTELLSLFRKYGRLIYELARRELGERYSGQVFGLFWSIGHPLMLMLIYVFIFGFVFRTRVTSTIDMPLDYTSYMFAGLIPWLAFQDVLAKSCTVIVGNASLVKRVVFPLEVLPIKGVVVSVFTQLVFVMLFMLYSLIMFHHLNWLYLLLPVLLMIQTAWMVGLAYLLGAIGPYFRDIKDFVQVFNTIAMFILPIPYLPQSLPVLVRPVLYINPFSYLIWCWQDVLYFGHFNHPYAWVVLTIFSLVSFVFGYRVFRKLKTMFGNVL
jgi:lipopolysaccharide transport system permease protein